MGRMFPRALNQEDVPLWCAFSALFSEDREVHKLAQSNDFEGSDGRLYVFTLRQSYDFESKVSDVYAARDSRKYRPFQ